MKSPENRQDSQIQMPDSFGTGKPPIPNRSYLPVTLLLLLILLGANLMTFALYFRIRDGSGIEKMKTVLLPGSEEMRVISQLPDGQTVQVGIQTSDAPLSDAELTQKLLPSIVKITDQTKPEITIGSGVVLTQDGYILTNAHSVASSHALNVILSDQSEHTAVCVGADDESDLAVLKIEAEALQPAELGASDSYEKGDRLKLLTQDGRLENVKLSHIRSQELGAQTVQVFFVNSTVEGFLTNRSGQVIAIRFGTERAETRALPMTVAEELAGDLIRYGCINPQASLGMQVTQLSDIQRRYWQLPQGVRISRVVPDGSADSAGLQEGDLLLKIDALEIHTLEDYQEALALLHPGDTVQLLIYRHGQEYTVSIVMQNS